METDSTSEFEFFLCEQLGGMTVSEMRQRMSGDEFTGWAIYYGRKAQREQMANLRAGG